MADVAKARPAELAAAVEHLGLKAAAVIVQGAKLLLTERVEQLRDEAEAVMIDMGS